MQPIPDLTAEFQPAELLSADLLNERITNPVNWLLGQSGATGFDLTPLGRDNGRGRLILPFQGATGRPTAIMLDRTGNAVGAIILFNDNGDLAIATPSGQVHPLQIEDLTWPAGTAAGSIIYATSTPHPAYPDRLGVATLAPAAGVLASDGGAPAWDSNYTPAGVDWRYSPPVPEQRAQAVVIWTTSVTALRRAGQPIAITPPMPHGGVVYQSIELTSRENPAEAAPRRVDVEVYVNEVQVSAALGGSINFAATTAFTASTSGNEVTFNRGDRLEYRMAAGEMNAAVITLRGLVAPVPAALV